MSNQAFKNIIKNLLRLLLSMPREDKRDREAPYTPYSIGNSSRVIFKTTDPKGDKTTANHIARMCSAWMTHTQSHASFTN